MTDYGYTIIGSNTFNETYGRFGSKITISKDIVATSISAYLNDIYPATTCQFAIYSDNAGVPDILIATTDTFRTDYSEVPKWYSANFASPVSLIAGVYWIFSYDQGNGIVKYYDSGSTNQTGHIHESGFFSNPFGTCYFEDWVDSIYITGTPSGTIITYSTDSLLKKLDAFTTNPIDVLFKSLDITGIYSVDITFALARLYSIDVLLKQIYGLTITDSIDVLLKKMDITGIYSIDMVLANMRQYSMGILTKKIDLTTTEQLDLQMILKNLTKTNSIDALVKKLGATSTCGLDIFISSSSIPTPVSVDGIALDFIIKFERKNRKITFIPEWINQTETVETYMWNKSLLELDYTFRVTDDTRWNMDQSFRGHSKVYLTDYIHNLFGSVWILKIESKWNEVNWERPWETTIHLLAMPAEITGESASVIFDSTGHSGTMILDGTTITLSHTETLDVGVHDVFFTPSSGTFEWLITGRISVLDSVVDESGGWISIFVYGSGTITAYTI